MPSPGAPRRLLCVDDNPTALAIRSTVLEYNGYVVAQTTSEREALSLMRRQPFDGVVLDYLMPDMLGSELATLIRAEHPHLPIILISGAVEDPEDIGGADIFVSKTAGSRRLLEVLSEILGRRSSPAA